MLEVSVRCVVRTVDRVSREGIDRANGAFQIRVVFKEDAATTRYSLVKLGSGLSTDTLPFRLVLKAGKRNHPKCNQAKRH